MILPPPPHNGDLCADVDRQLVHAHRVIRLLLAKAGGSVVLTHADLMVEPPHEFSTTSTAHGVTMRLKP